MNKLKAIEKNKGITLIALIITIVVLLILASVSIAMLTGENGIIAKAQTAKTETNKAQEEEKNKISDLENKLEISSKREESHIQTKRTILFDAQTDSNGPITATGATDGSSERTFTDNINNYDIILLYVGASSNANFICPPTIIDKSDFNKSVNYYMGSYSNNVSICGGVVKIDTTNNKIIYESKEHSYHQITKVIGIKF